MTALPASAEIVIVGGGIVGCSVAYHLTQAGQARRRAPRAGAAHLRHDLARGGARRPAARAPSMTRLEQHSIELYARLEAETGLATGWKQCGSIIVARTPERMTLLRRGRGLARPRRASPATSSRSRRRPSAIRSWRPTTCSARCGCRATARRTPPTSRRRWRRAPACAAPRSSRRPGHGHPREGRPRRRRRDGRGRRSRPRVVVNCAGQWAQAVGAHVRRHRAAALGRALLHRDRPDPRRAPGPAGDARPRRLHLLQGRGRRPAHRRLRAGGEALGDGRHPGAVRVPAAARGLGPVPDPDGERAHPPARPAHGRDQELRQRPRELHAGRQLHPRRGAGAARASSSRRASTRSASRAAAAPAGRSPSGSSAASPRSTCGRSTSGALRASTATTPGCDRASARCSACTT